jgi:hypothetical protein
MELSMKEMRSDLALVRLLDALEAELLAALDAEIRQAVAETGMKAGALLVDPTRMFRSLFASPLEAEVGDAEHRRVGGMPQPSRPDRKGGDSTPHPDLRSDLPLKGGDA